MPGTKSFLKVNELIFKPYDAIDLQRILSIRVQKALRPDAVAAGVIEKIAGLASREHGDARRAVALLARSAFLAEKVGTDITLELVDDAAEEIEQDRYITMIRTAPPQLQATMVAVIEATRAHSKSSIDSSQAYERYIGFCQRSALKRLTARAFGDLLAELDIYTFVRARIESRGRHGRTRRITLELPENVVAKIHEIILGNFDLSLGRRSLTN